MGVLEAYYPVRRAVEQVEASVAPFFKATYGSEARVGDGCRLDELIIELSAALAVTS